MKKGLAEIVVVLDESGSMNLGKDDTIGGFNEFLKTQKKLDGEANFTLVKFSDYYKVVNEGVDIQHAAKLNEANYVPSYSTALLDACGRAINSVNERMKKTPKKDRAEKVIFAVITDGHENASKEFTRKQIFDMVKEMREKKGWEFLFLGADIDAWGQEIGITTNVSYSKADTMRNMKAMSYYTSNVRSCSADLSMDNFSLSEVELDAKLKEAEKK